MRALLVMVVLAAGLCSCLLSGCAGVSSDLEHTRDMIAEETGMALIDTETQWRCGAGTLFLGRLAARLAGADREAVSYMKDVKGIQIGVYILEDEGGDRSPVDLRDIRKRLARRGYGLLVSAKSPDETALVMTKIRGNRLKALYVIALEHGELTIVKVSGRLERLIEKAIREGGFGRDEFMAL